MTNISWVRCRPHGIAGAVLVLILAGHSIARCGATPEWRALEAKAHERELGGDLSEASRMFAEASALAAAHSAQLGRDSSAAANETIAWCEVLAENAYQLTNWTYEPGEILQHFEAARNAALQIDSKANHELVSWLTYRIAQIASRIGRDERAATEYRRLGFITDWRVIGPFENEKGGGFDTAYPPEKEVSYAATYEGKKHPVKWRQVPVVPPDGVIDLDAMFRPNEECIAYAVTFVRSPSRREVEIRLATDDGCQLWLNGVRLASNNVERACLFDQDVIPAILEEGWNRILIKVADMKFDWEFSLRLTDRSGATMRDLSVASATVHETSSTDSAALRPEHATGGNIRFFAEKLSRIHECADGEAIEIVEGEAGLLEALSSALGSVVTAEAALSRSSMARVFKEKTAEEWCQSLARHLRPVGKVERARLSYGMGRLLASRGAHGVKDHPDRAAMLHAVELDPKNPVYIYALSRVATDWVVMDAERNENPRVRILNDLLLASPKAAIAHYELASYYLRSQGNVPRALEHASAALATNNQFALAEMVLRDSYSHQGFEELARARLQALAEKYPQNVIVQGRWAHELQRVGRAKDALRVYEDAYDSDHDVDTYRTGVASCLISSGKLYAAIEMEKRRVARAPFGISPRMELARLYEAKGDYSTEAAICREALQISPDDHTVLERLGRALQDLGQKEEALSVWRRALELAPNFVQLERYLEFLESKMTYDRRFEEDVTQLIEQSRGYKPVENDPLVEVLDKTIYRVNLDGTGSRTIHKVVLVRNNAGIEALGTPYVFFYPDEQVVKIRKITVYRSDGTVEEAPTGDGGRRYPAGYAGRSAIVLDIPPLRSGDVVEYLYRVDDTKQGFFGNYFGETHQFQGSYPRLRSKYVLIVPTNRAVHFNTRGTDLEPVRTEWAEENAFVYTWTLEPAPKIHEEPLMPPSGELGAQIQMSTYADWQELGTWYWNLVKEAHQTNPELETMTEELVAGADSELETIRRIYDFVSTKIQYSAWEFGVHGFKPYRATKIFDQKFGDCKDKATLMKTMLGLVGIESHPVLLKSSMRRPDEDLALPLFEHFNHMILYVPPAEHRGELWLDGTTTLHSLEVIPVSDAGALSCVIYPDGGRLKRIPFDAPSGNSIKEQAQFLISLSEDKLIAQMQLSSALSGWSATFARYRYNDTEVASKTLERLYAKQFPSARVLHVSTSDLEDISIPAKIDLRAYVPELGVSRQVEGKPRWFFKTLASPFGGVFRGEWSLLAPEALSDFASLASREHDLVLSVPWRYENTVVYELTRDLEFSNIPKSTELVESFGRFSLTYELTANAEAGDEDPPAKLTVRKVIEISANRIKANEYEAFRAFVNRADRTERREIEVSRVR